MQVGKTALLEAIDEQIESFLQQMQRRSDEACRTEQQKRQQSETECKELQLENESLTRTNVSCLEELIPHYEKVFQLQKQNLDETEAKNLKLEVDLRAVEEKLAQTQKLLEIQNQKEDGYRAEIQVLSEAKPIHGLQSDPAIGKRLRSCRLVKNVPAKRTLKCRVKNPAETDPGA